MSIKIFHTMGQYNFEHTLEATDDKAVFEKLAEICSLKEICGYESCGVCGNHDISYRVREAEDKKKRMHKYYELICGDWKCRAKLAFGQNLEAKGLFPKLKAEKDGKPVLTADGKPTYLPHGGWVKYDPKVKDQEQDA